MSKNPKVSDKIVFRQDNDFGILFNPETGDIKVLNQTASLIWELCNGKNTKEDIVNAISTKFNVRSKAIVAKDLDKFLKETTELGFIKI